MDQAPPSYILILNYNPLFFWTTLGHKKRSKQGISKDKIFNLIRPIWVNKCCGGKI